MLDNYLVQRDILLGLFPKECSENIPLSLGELSLKKLILQVQMKRQNYEV